MAGNSNEINNHANKKAVSDGVSKSWWEKQVEKIVGEQQNMQPIIRACLSIAGFIGGFVTGYFVFGKEKDRKLQEQELLIRELRQENREQEKEIKERTKESDETRSLTLRLETENKLLKEGKKEKVVNRELNGFMPVKSAGHSYLG